MINRFARFVSAKNDITELEQAKIEKSLMPNLAYTGEHQLIDHLDIKRIVLYTNQVCYAFDGDRLLGHISPTTDDKGEFLDSVVLYKMK